MADEHLVTGIAQTAEPEHIQTMLCNILDCNRVVIITPDSPTAEHHNAMLTFIHAGDMAQTTDTSSDVIRGNAAIMTNIDGVNVPGISSDSRFVGYFAHPQVIDHLADWPIPSDQVQNYNDAIDAGRSVVTYKTTPEDAPAAEQAFKEAGLKNVKTFSP
ncbi:MAG: hypothetical protein M3N19_06005 [Candidatus Eremiobacteraeota bacterium]|nr:hypothetical protein [Candidatus Eremiobacteraeota bacterium]